MALSESLERLKNARCERGILTIYLNTLRTRNSEWKLRLKNGLKKWQEYIEARGNEQELKDYIMIKNKIMKEMKDQQRNLQKSIVIIASADEQIWEVHHLQLEIENEFHWETYPVINQLEKIHEKYPTVGIIVLRRKEVVAINTSLGEIIEESYFSLDPSKEYDREAFTNQNIVNTDSEKNITRSLKEIGATINRLAQTKKWKEVYMIGQQEFIEEMKKHLKVRLIKVIPKKLYNKPPQQIVGEILA